MSVAGRLLDETTGAPAQGARIDFVRTSGIALALDSVRGLTDRNGNFLVSVAASADGSVNAEMVLRGSDASGVPFEYRVFDLTFTTLREVGDAHVLPPWSTMPSSVDIAQITKAGVDQASLRGVNVEFRRTGGVRLAGSDVFRAVTGDNGVFPLFNRQVQPLDAGDVIGDLLVDYGGVVIRGLRVRTIPDFRRSLGFRIIDIGG